MKSNALFIPGDLMCRQLLTFYEMGSVYKLMQVGVREIFPILCLER